MIAMNTNYRDIRAKLRSMAPQRAIDYIAALDLPEDEAFCIIACDVKQQSRQQVANRLFASVEYVKKRRRNGYQKIRQGKAYQFGVHRHDRRPAPIAAQAETGVKECPAEKTKGALHRRYRLETGAAASPMRRRCGLPGPGASQTSRERCISVKEILALIPDSLI